MYRYSSKNIQPTYEEKRNKIEKFNINNERTDT